MSQYDPFDLKINVGHCDLYFMIQWSNFVLYLQDYLMNESYFQIMTLCDPNFDIKINIGQHDLFFMV